MPSSTQNKLSKKTVVIGLALVFLVVGLIAGLIVVRQSVDIRNRASELTCRMNLLTCSWKWDGELPQGADPVQYEYSVLGPCNNTEAHPCSGTTDKTSIQFEGYPGGTFTCNIRPKVVVGGKVCSVDEATGTGSCPVDSPSGTGGSSGTSGSGSSSQSTTSTSDNLTSRIERGEQCSCSDDGGKLNCNPTDVEDYASSSGSGLIVLEPVYEVGDNACFACQKIRVKDSSGDVVREVDGCSLKDSGDSIRIHQAPASGGSCETYTVEAIGAQGEQKNPQTCQTCNHTVCCPACVPPENLDVAVQSDPNKPLDTKLVDSCSFQCDFSIDFGTSNQCGASGQNITLNVPAGGCVDTDNDYADKKTVCDTDNDGVIEFSYDRGGVYDLALDCKKFAVSSATIGGDDGTESAISSLPPDLKCTKRISVACGGGGSQSTTESSEQSTDSTTPSTDTDSSGSSCKALDVQLICHNCDAQ